MWRAEICAAVACLATLILVWKFTRCIHPWNHLDKTELPSLFEECKKQGWMPTTMFPSDIARFARKTIIIVITCPKCGKVKVLRESNG